MTSPAVCFVGKYPFGRQSGSVTYLRLLARAARRLGFAPHLFCVGPRDETREADFGVVHVIRAPGGRDWPPLDNRAPLYAPWLVRELVRFGASQGRPLLVHGLSQWAWSGLVAARVLGRRGVGATVVATAYDLKTEQTGAQLRNLHGADGLRVRLGWRFTEAWDRSVSRWFERQVCAGASLVLVNYASVRRLLIEAFGPGVPVRLIPYTAETALHRPHPPPAPPVPPEIAALAAPGAPLVVAVSRHVPLKGLDLLLEALATLRARGCSLRACLLGPGQLLERHRALARALGLQAHTTIPGQVDDPWPYLRHADVFVLPSLGEGGSGSIALLEALMAGTAVVASACDGVPEDVTHGHDALLVEPGNRAELVEALGRVLGDAELRSRLSLQGRETFWRRFSPDAFVDALGRAYRDLGFAPPGSSLEAVPSSRG